MERYNIIKNVDRTAWNKDCPVQTDKYNILFDNKLQKTVLQLKFRNVSDKRLQSVYMNIVCFDDAKDRLGEMKNIYFTGLDCNTNENFGSNEPVATDFRNTAYTEILITKAVFSDESVWRNENNEPLRLIDKNTSAREYYGNLYEQYKRECSSIAARTDYTYKDEGDYWICTCGQPNNYSNKRCLSCHTEREKLAKISNKEYLKEQLDKYNKLQEEIRLREEAEAKEKAEREAKEAQQREEERQLRRKKQMKYMTTVCVSALIVAIIVVGSVFGLKFYSATKKYNEAKALFDKGSFEQAEAIYTELGDFRDSHEMITECEYQQAEYFFSLGDYTQSSVIYNKLGDYKDCKEKIAKCQEGLNEYNYNKAMDLLEKNDYAGARKIFEALGDYKDSKQRISNIDLELKYRNAISVYDSGKYEEALNAFNAVKDYKEAGSYIAKCKQNIDKYNYKQAYKNYIAGVRKIDNYVYLECFYEEYSLIDFDGNGIEELVLYGGYPESDVYRTDIYTYKDGTVKKLYGDDKGFSIYYSSGNSKYYAMYSEIMGNDYMYAVNCNENTMSMNLELSKTQDENGYTDILNSFPGVRLQSKYDIHNLSPLK